MGAADRSAAPRRSAQPGGCRSFCSPQTICSAWGLQIVLQPPDDLLSLGAADRSAAPRRSAQPGGCRSICSPQTISSAWGLQIDLQPPDDLLSLGAADRSAQPGGCRSICSPQTICSTWGLQIDLQPFPLSAWGLQIDLQPPPPPLSLGAADRSAAPTTSSHPGGCRSICSPHLLLSAWGLKIDLQPPPPPLSLGAADRSAAPTTSSHPGGCRSICSPHAPHPPHLRRVESRDSTQGKYITYPASSRATRRQVSRGLVQPHGAVQVHMTGHAASKAGSIKGYTVV
ncbi:hypothetical protein PGTUg99_034405 [Puccinia graminis f. sp. tritici]|uniref:Uncharacterized protein n=1 Tax=Puccinia graminis f. sp. tritici TaxID=56615 RepID=A0A5B0RHR7_PUCGR|nr:hypothetical protein PGTUg99_034405 [Puccinia graminis f. sp. tritici]